MEPAIHDLARELERSSSAGPRSATEGWRGESIDSVARLRVAELEVDLELEIVDDVMLDPWFFRTEAEIAQIEDDPTARIIEIKIGPLPDQGTGFDDSAFAF